MVLDNKVSISIMSCVMFRRFLSFDIPIVLKMFLLCFLKDYISFSYLCSSRKQISYHVMFMALFRFSALYNKFLQNFLLCFQYFNLFLPIKLRETRFIWF